MKVLLAAIFFAVMSSSLAFGQSIDDLRGVGRQLVSRLAVDTVNREMSRRERTKVSRSTSDYNVEAPGFDFRDATFELDVRDDQWSSSRSDERWLGDSIAHLLTGAGAVPVWGIEGVRRESEEREYIASNRWVDDSTRHPERTIQVARYRAEITALMADRREDMDASWGRWFSRGLDLSFSREVRYAGLILQIRNKRTGKVVTSFKVIGYATGTNRAAVNIGTSLFGDRFGFDQRGDPGSRLEMSAIEDALKQMRGVLERKTTQYRRVRP